MKLCRRFVEISMHSQRKCMGWSACDCSMQAQHVLEPWKARPYLLSIVQDDGPLPVHHLQVCVHCQLPVTAHSKLECGSCIAGCRALLASSSCTAQACLLA